MSVDLTKSYQDIGSTIKAFQTYVETLDNSSKLKEEAKDNLSQNIINTTTTADKLKTQNKRYQRQEKTQLDELIEIFGFNAGSGLSSIKYLKTKFIQAALNAEPKLFEILTEESIKALGCSIEQTYAPNLQGIYIDIRSIDLNRLLQNSPESTIGQLSYETNDPVSSQIPYSMNRQIWSLIQSIGNPVSIYGASKEKLFDVSYVTQDNNGTPGDFLKIELFSLQNNINSVSNFIVDYYKSIKLLDTNNFFQNLLDVMLGSVSFTAEIGFSELKEKRKFNIILQRILGLCFDSTREIDVTGNSKISELDGVDTSFFELTDIDLRNIELEIDNIQNGVIEFEDCDNVKLPLNNAQILSELIKFNSGSTINYYEEVADNLTNIIINNNEWKILIPSKVNLDISLNLSFVKNLPKALLFALLSPKVLLPLLIMSRATAQKIGNFTNYSEFINVYNKYLTNIMSKVGSLFIEELFLIIKKDIFVLVSRIKNDLYSDKKFKKYAIVLKLAEAIIILAKAGVDWRKCKSVVDEMVRLLQLVNVGNDNRIPSYLLAFSSMLDGYSTTRAKINVLEELQKLGIPTNPMPDGSPNLMNQFISSMIDGIAKEQYENGKVQVFVPPLVVNPATLTTIPQGSVFGKWF
jgi:hypothetical protein